MAISYTDNLDEIHVEMLTGFFEGWPSPPNPGLHLEILRRSYRVWLALDDGASCIGFINALSDGVFYAHLPMLEVLPAYRGRGIGTKLVRLMLQSLRRMYAVDVVCDPELESFYQKFGLQRCTAMVARNFDWQNAASDGDTDTDTDTDNV